MNFWYVHGGIGGGDAMKIENDKCTFVLRGGNKTAWDSTVEDSSDNRVWECGRISIRG